MWLVPARDDQEPYASTIERLAASHPGSPTFAPHVTLLTGLGVDERPLEELVKELKRTLAEWSSEPMMELSLDAPRAGRIFFQAVTQPVRPHAQLLDLRERLEVTLNKPTPVDRPYYPHLSLLYSDKPFSELEEIAGELVQHGTTVRMVEVTVVHVQGPVEEWREVARVGLGG